MLAAALETRLAVTQVASPVDRCASARFRATRIRRLAGFYGTGSQSTSRYGCPATAGWFDETFVGLKPDWEVTSPRTGLRVFFLGARMTTF
jgi:hypothetical protein